MKKAIVLVGLVVFWVLVVSMNPVSTLAADDGSVAVAVASLVNLNQATVADLETLPGVGRSIAERIVAFREAHGPFLAKEDLKQIKGIGEKKYQSLSELVVVQ